VTTLIDPAALLWLFLLLFGAALFAKRRRAPGAVLIAFCAAWWLMDWTATPSRLLASLEEPYIGTGQAPAVDAIIVLGGGVALSSNDFAGLDFGIATDRILTGVDLARRGLGKTLVLGGSATLKPKVAPEPGLLRDWIVAWNLADVPLTDLGSCRNTRDEAIRAAELAREQGWSRVLLVTSAWHMKRSEAAFQKAGLDIIPVGCDFMGTAALRRSGSWMPQSQSMILLQLWLHEIVGFWYYRIRGWV
jgi:uncharacterized SAM-binding protein YcdF (DUF218 family)